MVYSSIILIWKKLETLSFSNFNIVYSLFLLSNNNRIIKWIWKRDFFKSWVYLIFDVYFNKANSFDFKIDFIKNLINYSFKFYLNFFAIWQIKSNTFFSLFLNRNNFLHRCFHDIVVSESMQWIKWSIKSSAGILNINWEMRYLSIKSGKISVWNP